jgi:hypothetical protein
VPGPLHALLAAESVTVHAINPVAGAADFANHPRAYRLRRTQRHVQPVADEQPNVNIEYERLVLLLRLAVAARSVGAEPCVRWLVSTAHVWKVDTELRRSRQYMMFGGVLVVICAVWFFTAKGDH